MKPWINRLTILIVFLGLNLASVPAQARTSYGKTLKTWSRSDTFYSRKDSFANVAVTATYFSRAFLDARFEEYSRKYDLSPEERERYWNTHLETYAAQPAFFMAFYTRDKKWNELEKAGDEPLWRFELKQGGESCQSSEIKRLKPLSPEDAYFFPYVSRWDRPYIITFPSDCRLSENTPFTLKVMGVYGEVKLHWKGRGSRYEADKIVY